MEFLGKRQANKTKRRITSTTKNTPPTAMMPMTAAERVDSSLPLSVVRADTEASPVELILLWRMVSPWLPPCEGGVTVVEGESGLVAE